MDETRIRALAREIRETSHGLARDLRGHALVWADELDAALQAASPDTLIAGLKRLPIRWGKLLENPSGPSVKHVLWSDIEALLNQAAASPVPRVETCDCGGPLVAPRCECAICLLNASRSVPRSTPVQRTHEED
jgi:hypothetical protein